MYDDYVREGDLLPSHWWKHEDSMRDIIKRINTVFSDRRYISRLDASDKRWLDDDISIVTGSILDFLKKPTGRFKKDLKKAQKRGYNISLLTDIISKLAEGEELPEQNRDHALVGNYSGQRECHITPDWLLIYEIDEEILYLYLTRTGTHSDL